MKLFAELNREQLRALAPDALIVLPLGATEQHGPHLPTGTDYFTVESLSREAGVRCVPCRHFHCPHRAVRLLRFAAPAAG